MVMDNTLPAAWAIDGSQTDAQIGRLVAWCATGGSTGVVLPGDMQVRALSTPAGSVNVNPGAAVAPTGYPSQAYAQSYIMTLPQAYSVTIPPTGSSGGRTDYIIVQVDDTNYSGNSAPNAPLTASYWQPLRVSSLSGLNYPFVPLAQITIPASTSAITQSMITDLRQVANPQQQRMVDFGTCPSGTTITSAWAPWPSQAVDSVAIPTWATKAFCRVDVQTVYIPAALATGAMRLAMSASGQPTQYSNQITYYFDDTTLATRHNMSLVGLITIPAAFRGLSSVTFQQQGMLTSSTAAIVADQYSTWAMDLEFVSDASLF